MRYLDSVSALETAISELSHHPVIWLDTEIADWWTRHPKLSLIQVSMDPHDRRGEQVMILDVLHHPSVIEHFIETIMINPAIEKVFHNASFDVRYLGQTQVQRVTCTLKMARKIPKHLLGVENYKLQTLATRLCHFTDIDKGEQSSDWGRRPLSQRQLDYARMDPVYLVHIHQALRQFSVEYTQPPARKGRQSLDPRR